MPFRKIALLFFPVFITFSVLAQDSTITYKASQWIDLKKYGNLVRAMENPVKEKAVIVQSEESFKVTLGPKVLEYKIVLIQPFSDNQTRYTTTLNGKQYLLSVTAFPNNLYSVGADNDKESGEWMVYPVSEVSRQASKKSAVNGQ